MRLNFKGYANVIVIGQHHAENALLINQLFGTLEQRGVSQGLGATRIMPRLVTAGHSRFKIRRIADDQIILRGVMFSVIINILRLNLNALGQGDFCTLSSRLLSGGFVQFHRVDHHLSSRTLRQHQRNQSCYRYRCPAPAALVPTMPKHQETRHQSPLSSHSDREQ